MRPINLSETGLWSTLNQNLRNRIDEHVICELRGLGSQDQRDALMHELAEQLLNLYVIRRDETTLTLEFLKDVLETDKESELRAWLLEAVRGQFALRKVDLQAKEYIETFSKLKEVGVS